MNLPKDPDMLASFLNLKLRDYYTSLASLCDDLSLEEANLLEQLAAAGYSYDAAVNRVIEN